MKITCPTHLPPYFKIQNSKYPVSIQNTPNDAIPLITSPLNLLLPSPFTLPSSMNCLTPDTPSYLPKNSNSCSRSSVIFLPTPSKLQGLFKEEYHSQTAQRRFLRAEQETQCHNRCYLKYVLS
jgi:hypothetical protein